MGASAGGGVCQLTVERCRSVAHFGEVGRFSFDINPDDNCVAVVAGKGHQAVCGRLHDCGVSRLGQVADPQEGARSTGSATPSSTTPAPVIWS